MITSKSNGLQAQRYRYLRSLNKFIPGQPELTGVRIYLISKLLDRFNGLPNSKGFPKEKNILNCNGSTFCGIFYNFGRGLVLVGVSLMMKVILPPYLLI